MSATLQKEISEKTEILQNLNDQQYDQIIKQKQTELETLSKENVKLQEVTGLAIELDSEKKNLQAINAALQMEEIQSRFPEKERELTQKMEELENLTKEIRQLKEQNHNKDAEALVQDKQAQLAMRKREVIKNKEALENVRQELQRLRSQNKEFKESFQNDVYEPYKEALRDLAVKLQGMPR